MGGCSHGGGCGSECSHDCGSCGENCASRQDPKSFLVEPHKKSSIKRVIGVASGKGGVGKSLVSALLACSTRRAGYSAAILDADITGPSIPKAFGLDVLMTGTEEGIDPVKTKTGISCASINLLMQDPSTPVVWRGPVIAGAVKQFWSDAIWTDVDYMYVDMPPGTGDVPLTVFQSIPMKGVIIVATPQDLVSLIVEKAIRMAEMMSVPVLGIVENMSYYECPDCGKRHSIFGESKTEELASRHGIEKVVKLPINPSIASACDRGEIESVVSPEIDEAFAYLRARLD